MEADISKIDKNFAGEEIASEGMKFYPVRDPRFSIHGLFRPYELPRFQRMPDDVASAVNENVRALYIHTAGGRIRFRTDSERIFLRAVMPHIARHDHMPKTGSSCFDLYADGRYVNTFRHGMLHGLPEIEKTENTYDSGLALHSREMRDILINFPTYNPVDNVYIGLDEDAVIAPAKPYRFEKPVVFYGSSITQGGCTSHPGNAYFNILSRKLDTEIINLGFSSGCHGEDTMAEYLAGLDMSVLVFDYDHNSGYEELKEHHERSFSIIRKRRPELPIIMISAADRRFGVPERKAIIEATYRHALERGDKNVYFIDGMKIYEEVGADYCTVDDIHPNDIGFYQMAKAVEPVLRTILEKQEK